MLLTLPTPAQTVHRCALCGAEVLGGSDGCSKLFDEILIREYGDPRYGAVHLFSVDAYVLQHSEQHGPRSNAFHLIRLCWLLEGGGDPRIGRTSSRFQPILSGYRQFPFLEPPANRGDVTAAEVIDAAGPEEHAERVRRWAQSVWQAWMPYHEWARKWLRAYPKEGADPLEFKGSEPFFG